MAETTTSDAPERIPADITKPSMQMPLTDLSELHILLRVYIQCYGTGERDSELLAEVEARYRLLYRRRNHSDAPAEITNPRNAGRKPVVEPEKAERVRQLYTAGKTMRETAAMESCSASHVFKLIHEHDQHI
ncbi:MAG: hypothetical protein LIP11_02685 [Clostridiales bacterium]|nr:hypothetical protein [Clostridiales bacterium]